MIAAVDRLRIVVLGYIVRGPLGGLAWHHAQYVLGLHRLGHDVVFLEDSGDDASCYDPVRDVTDTDPTVGLAFAAGLFERLGLAECWAYDDRHTGRMHGPAAERARDSHAHADLLLNLSGVTPLRPWMMAIPARAFVDTDPVFTQIRHLTDPAARELACAHTAFVSFGENVGRPGCRIPDDGFPWQPTRQPVVLDAWPVTPGPRNGRFTTVMQWESYPAREHAGHRYGMKSDSFAEYVDLPARAPAAFELALGSPSAPRARLAAAGWIVSSSLVPTRDPWAYQRFIQASKAEFTVAKHGYVTARTGWFSERSAAYLASGRPVVTQDTGFSSWLAAGRGVVPFGSLDEAVDAVRDVNARYDQHCRAARRVAEEYFDARHVLPGLIERAVQPPVVRREPRSVVDNR